jgi:hypothetical protein
MPEYDSRKLPAALDELMPASWDFLLCSGNGEPLAELTTASGKQIKYSRNRFAEAQFVLSHQDAAAQALMEAIATGPMPTLRAYRKSPGQLNGTLRFNGYLSPFTEQLDEQQLITAIFRSPFGRLYGNGSSGTGRYMGASNIAEEKNTDNIAASLILLYGGKADGKIGEADPTFNELKYEETSYAGLGIGTIATTVPRTIAFRPYKNVGQAIINLSECLDGFDFDETYVEETGTEPTLALFNTYAKQGEVRPSALFQYGPTTLSNVSGVQRTTGSPINIVTLKAEHSLVATAEEPLSVAKYGQWMYYEVAADADNLEILESRAKALLREGPVKTLSITPDFAVPNCPLPFDDFWLGDTVPFYGNAGAFQENLQVRVNEMTIVIDENGNETSAIPDPYSPTQESPDALHTVFKVQA